MARINVLHLEDNDADAELIKITLEDSFDEVSIVKTSTFNEFIQALDQHDFSIVLSDYHVPGIDDFDALLNAAKHQPDIPFIYVSGAIGEELAVEALHQGATDYVMKNNLTKLPQVIKRSLKEKQDRIDKHLAELEVIKSNERYKELTESAQIAILVMQENSWVYANPFSLELFGYTRQELFALEFMDIVHPDDHEVIAKRAKDRLAGKEVPANYECQMITKAGEKIYVEATAQVIQFEGKPAILGTAINISDRKKAERDIREYERFFSISNEMLCIANTDGYFEKVNAMFTSVLGYSEHELLNTTFYDFIHPDDVADTHAEANKLAQGHRTIDFTNRYRCADGSYKWLSWSATPDSETGKLFAAARDVTQQREIQTALVESEKRNRNILEAIPDIMFTIDSDGRYIDRLLDDEERLIIPWVELEGKTKHEVMNADVANLHLRMTQAAIITGQTQGAEYFLEENGHKRYYESRFVKTGADRVLQIIRDVTERRRSELAKDVAVNVARLAQIPEVDVKTACKATHDELSKIMVVENFYVALYDEESNMLRFPYSSQSGNHEFFEDREFGKGLTEYVIKTKKPLFVDEEVYDNLAKNGDVEFMGKAAGSWIGAPLIDGPTCRGVIVVQLFHRDYIYDQHDLDVLELVASQLSDVINRKRWEQEILDAYKALGDSEKRFRELAETIKEAFWLTDWKNEKVLYVSPAYEPIYGLSRQSLLDDATSWKIAVHPDDLSNVEETYYREAETGRYDMEFRVVHADGTLKWVHERAFPIIENDEVVRVAGYSIDITDRKLAELKQEVSFNIAKAANRRITTISTLSEAIHKELTRITEVPNLHVAMFDLENSNIEFPYYKDELAENSSSTTFQKRMFGKSLTEYVIRNKRAVNLNKSKIQNLVKDGVIKLIGTTPEYYIGIPLKGDGRIVGVLGIPSYYSSTIISDDYLGILEFSGRQITSVIERQIALDNIERSEERYRMLTEHSTDMVFILDDRGFIRYASSSTQRVLGIKHTDLMGRSARAFLGGDQEIMYNGALKFWKSGKTGKLFRFEFKNDKGKTVWLEVNGTNQLDNPAISGFVINARDITARRKVEDDLNVTMLRLYILNEIETAIMRAESIDEIANSAQQLIRELAIPADRASLSIFDIDKQEAFFIEVHASTGSEIDKGKRLPLSAFRNIEKLKKGKHYVVHNIGKQGISESDKLLLKEGINSYLVYPLVYKNELIGSLNFGSSQPNYFTKEHINLVKDLADPLSVAIYDSKLNAEIKQREAEFSEIFDSISDMYFKADLTGVINLVSPSAREMIGFEASELVGRMISDLFVKKESSNEYIEMLNEQGKLVNYEQTITHKDGREINVMINAEYIWGEDNKREAVRGTIIDITELKQAQATLEEQHKKGVQYQSMLLSSQINPHFIFNALNSIQYYILDERVEPALDFISEFSKLMRSVLGNSLHQRITIAEEINFLQLYLDLEKKRYSNKFQYAICYDEDFEIEELQVPPMLLQPYIENTVVHGVGNLQGGGQIDIVFKEHKSNIICTITDNGIGRERADELKKLRVGGQRHKSMGMGITSTRLNLLNSLNEGDYDVQVKDLKDKEGESLGTEIIVSFPKQVV